MNVCERNVPARGHIIREKALEFAKELNIPDFKASLRWLEHWEKRYSIIFRTIPGEERSCTADMIASWEHIF